MTIALQYNISLLIWTVRENVTGLKKRRRKKPLTDVAGVKDASRLTVQYYLLTGMDIMKLYMNKMLLT